ncbi:YdcF family protein [Legionella bononiensis]|uniref:YdcF family protein n=1 Tax=Legionella bononiensis TaxID=2793102 RepID=A0ABS1WA69_9GAMM|nr:ElyC/SanA/YdcF family protein [Legionella bononiensis]MBL7480504.1 YdcF family protein [Legionella bononiensis]MBL7526256.1 YdcF family protein [Legionella bononiensis]MBL7563248.1 YdcF family protein [Legionella bononiensis]
MAVFRHLIELFINPFFLCFFLLGICTYLVWFRSYSQFVRRTLLLVFLTLTVISTGWLPRYMTYNLESQYTIVTKPDPDVRWVVVLSGGQTQAAGLPPNDLLSSASMKRLIEGVRLLRLLPEAKLVLSGGGSAGDQPEALLLAELARWFSIPDHKVVLETKSINTADQARELVSLVKNEPFYLVTSAVHMPRAMALCQKQGLHPIAAPTDFTFFWSTDSWGKLIIPNAYNLAYFSIGLHEVLGSLWAFKFMGQ